jgi:prepilin-type N-terminal cleavage/methylation domain-containing protein
MSHKKGRVQYVCGFTLIEIMISMAILSVLFILVYGTFNATFKASEQMESEADDYRLARLGFYHLTKDLSMFHIMGKPVTSTGPEDRPLIFIGEDRSRIEEGDELPNDLLKFTSVSHGRTMRDAPESDQVTVSYYLQGKRLVQEAILSNGRVIVQEIGEPIDGLNFRYLDPEDRSWINKWDAGEKKNRPPLAIEVEFYLKREKGEARRFKTKVDLPVGTRL